MKNLLKKEGKKTRAIIALNEIFLMVVSIISFSFILGGMLTFASEKIAAESMTSLPKGCCLEAKDGSLCQEMLTVDAGLCKENLVSTSCDLIEQCKVGCCYDPSAGVCSLNSPKSQCSLFGGNWSGDPKCNIPQCEVGCCMLGESAELTTTRECTILAEKYGLEKKFEAIDDDGTCSSKTGLSDKGACLLPSDDYSNTFDCKMSTKKNCRGDFYQGSLCTSKLLNTNCKKAMNTTCVEDKIFYVDSCGNLANVYDSSRYNNESYWDKIISPSDSCNTAGKDCGNCDYMQGNVCEAYDKNKDVKPTYGSYVCRDLNCNKNGRKHGESWCISDYNSETPASVVGSRNFRAVCLENEVSIEPCADFNQEICVEDSSSGFSEAACLPNEWRSCIAANEKETYEEVQDECDKYEQCIMFLDIPGNEKYENLPGFKKDLSNMEQGAAGDVGKDMNKVIAHCVPKYTPGMVFWSENTKVLNLQNNPNSQFQQTPDNMQGIGNGGSKEETEAICSLGSFTCVTKYEKKFDKDAKISTIFNSAIRGQGPAYCSATGDCQPEWNVKINEECYFLPGVQNEAENKVPLTVEALSERCRMLGPCGLAINVAGELGENDANSTIRITQIDGEGKSRNMPNIYHKLSEDYIGGLEERAGLVKAGSLSGLTSALFLSLFTGMAVKNDNSGNSDAETAITQAQGKGEKGRSWGEIGTGAISAVGLGSQLTFGFSGSLLGSYAWMVAWVAVAAIAGYVIGQLIGKVFGLSGASTNALASALAAGAGAGMLVYEVLVVAGVGGPIGWIILAVFVVVSLITYVFVYENHKYYVVSYTCEAWDAPEKGNCEVCNNDIRPCSEYRCKSLGKNCQYYDDNGEPGICKSGNDVNSARIKPWEPGLSDNMKYSEIKDTSFKIVSGFSQEIPAYTNVIFGIETSEYATCKIDNKRTKSYEEMAVEMTLQQDFAFTKAATQGLHHSVALSPYLGTGNSGVSTLALVKEQENDYYIRCKDFAGNVNEAEFLVRIPVGKGEDRVSPVIQTFIPGSENYLAKGTSSLGLRFYVNEPSICRYSKQDQKYEEMNLSANCITSVDSSILGTWPCYAFLNNLSSGENNFYFRCLDQPNIDERISNKRNVNLVSKSYKINVCSSGLNISSLSPKDAIIVGNVNSVSLDITTQTSGCINGGEATCYYKFQNPSYSSNYLEFLNTGGKSHSQKFTTLPTGSSNISIKCVDIAGNVAFGSLKIEVQIDSTNPKISRAYQASGNLILQTDEIANCRYTNNKTLGCGFAFETNSTQIESFNPESGFSLVHMAGWRADKDYFIKCADRFGNVNPEVKECDLILRTY